MQTHLKRYADIGACFSTRLDGFEKHKGHHYDKTQYQVYKIQKHGRNCQKQKRLSMYEGAQNLLNLLTSVLFLGIK